MKARFGGTDLIALVFFFVASASLAFAEANSKPLSYGLSRTIHSKVLNEDRTVSIAVPRPDRRLSAPVRESEDRQGGLRAGLRERIGAGRV